MLPSYQEILKNSYIHKIIKQLLKNNPLEIVEIENKYYIKDTNENLIFIQENMGRSYIKLKRILNSCIYFSSNSNNPMDCFININNKTIPRGEIDINLIQFLYMQCLINRQYFYE